tara:strand:- start:432 stop:551 length:120 start_codon:yes stop_codon:yes gene_type:complete
VVLDLLGLQLINAAVEPSIMAGIRLLFHVGTVQTFTKPE